MVTAAQVKSYLQPLIDENDDLALVGRLLVVKPVQHVLRAVLIDSLSWPEGMRPRWLIYHMFGPYPGYSLSWGDQFWGRSWRTDAPDIAEALRAKIQELALPRLREIRSLPNFVEAVPSTPGGHLWSIDPLGRALIDIATGDLDSARMLCRDNICELADPGSKEPDVTKAEVAGAKKLCALLENDDIAGLVQTLHEWEAANIKALKLAPYWQPTPFPIEEKLGLAAQR